MPASNNWKFLAVDNNGQANYYKDGIYDILNNKQVQKFGFDKDGNMLKGIFTYNGITYYTINDGLDEGVITNS